LQAGGHRDTARAMSQENLDLARHGYDAFARGDLDAAIEFMHPKIETHDPPEVPDATIYRGREAVRRDWEQTSDLFEDFSIDVEKSFDRGDEVVVFVRFRGRARESNAEVGAPMAHVWTIRDGKAVRLRQLLNRAEALEVWAYRSGPLPPTPNEVAALGASPGLS
jgi:ketosteroid isomerase-like protein